MRGALHRMLDAAENVELAGDVDDLDSVRRDLGSSCPDVLALDRGLLAGATIATIHELRERWPAVQLVILTSDDNAAFAERTVSAGALGFVLKQFADSELPAALHAVAGGEEYVSPRIAARLDALRRTRSASGVRAPGAEAQPERLRG